MLKYICSDVYSGASLEIVRCQENKKGRKIEMRKKGRKEEKEELSKKKVRENKKAGNETKKQGVWPIRQHTQGSKNGSKVEKTEGR